MSVIWVGVTRHQLSSIRDYHARSNPAYSESLLERIVARGESLDGRPFVGSEVPDYGDPNIREVYEHPYRILYRVDGSNVAILAVYHSARRLPRTPPT